MKRRLSRSLRNLIKIRVSWEPETTANNLSLIHQAGEKRQESVKRANEIEKALRHKTSQVSKTDK